MAMTKTEELERRILIKKQLIKWTKEDIRDMQERLKKLKNEGKQ